jgi:hypothetical protein
LNSDSGLLFPQSALLHFQIIPSNDQSSITVRMVLGLKPTDEAEPVLQGGNIKNHRNKII